MDARERAFGGIGEDRHIPGLLAAYLTGERGEAALFRLMN
jgi:hypothetical protein